MGSFVCIFLGLVWLVSGEEQREESYQRLLAVHEELVQLGRWPQPESFAQTGPESVRERWGRLLDLQAAWRSINPTGWEVPSKVDYLLVRARLNDLLFEHRVTRPWSRDPQFYLDLIRRLPYQEVPLGQEQLPSFQRRLEQVPRLLSLARQMLSEPAGELARMALFHLQNYDGVGQGEPLRENPPPGIIGWYGDLLSRVRSGQPELVPAAEEALGAVRAFRDWLAENLPRMQTPAAIGLQQYEWYLRNVRLMPFRVAELEAVAQRELSRNRVFLALEEHRNRRLPPLLLAAHQEEYEERVRRAEKQIRQFLQQEELLTLPAGLPERFETDAFWRPAGRRHFWEEIQYRNAFNNHIHASIPGHRFDLFLQQRHPNPIRRSHRDGGRIEGWAFYAEEMLLQAGLLEEQPRARELFYIANLARAARIPAELALQRGELDLQGAVQYMVEMVPLMEENLARYDLEIYLRRPAYGMNYLMGRVQIEALLADLRRQQGENFRIGRFHDDFLSRGAIPICLIRWEMTGLEDEIGELWSELSPFPF